MEKLSTADRLKEIMNSRNLRQVDILEKAKPFCKQHNIKMNKSDLSQYVSGLVEPGQDKLSILAMALGVSEAWLMGYDVPENSAAKNSDDKKSFISQGEQVLLHKYNLLDDKGKHTVNTILDMEYNRCNPPNTESTYLIAAHNDNLNDPEEQKKVRRDLDKF